MAGEKHDLQPWEMMIEARECIGMTALERIFSIGHKSLYKQMRNPDFTGESKRPMIQRVRMMLHDLEQGGGEELGRAMLDYMAAALGMHVESNASAVPDREDVRDECLDDLPPLTRFHGLIRDKKSMNAVQAAAVEAKREIDETVVAYRDSLEEAGEE